MRRHGSAVSVRRLAARAPPKAIDGHALHSPVRARPSVIEGAYCPSPDERSQPPRTPQPVNRSHNTAVNRDRWRRYGAFVASVAERARHGASYNPLSERTIPRNRRRRGRPAFAPCLRWSPRVPGRRGPRRVRARHLLLRRQRRGAHPPRRSGRLPRTPAGSTGLALDGYGLRDQLLARPTRTASYPVSVRQVAVLLHASFRHRLAGMPLRFANPSPPSGWIEDFHFPATEHAGHTTEPRSAAGRHARRQ